MSNVEQGYTIKRLSRRFFEMVEEEIAAGGLDRIDFDIPYIRLLGEVVLEAVTMKEIEIIIRIAESFAKSDRATPSDRECALRVWNRLTRFRNIETGATDVTVPRTTHIVTVPKGTEVREFGQADDGPTATKNVIERVKEWTRITLPGALERVSALSFSEVVRYLSLQEGALDEGEREMLLTEGRPVDRTSFVPTLDYDFELRTRLAVVIASKAAANVDKYLDRYVTNEVVGVDPTQDPEV